MASTIQLKVAILTGYFIEILSVLNLAMGFSLSSNTSKHPVNEATKRQITNTKVFIVLLNLFSIYLFLRIISGRL